MRMTRFAYALLLAAQTAPGIAWAGDEVFVCPEDQGKFEYIAVDLPHRKVKLTSGPCTLTFRDGAYGQVIGAASGGSQALCDMVLEGGMGASRHQRVTVDGDELHFDWYGPDISGNETSGVYVLNMRTGVLKDQGEIDATCHRAHG